MVVTVKAEILEPLAIGVTEDGTILQAIFAFKGAMAQLNATAELNPLNEVTVILDVPELPAITVAEAGLALKLKS